MAMEVSARYEVRNATAWVTVNRPERLNAINRNTLEEIAVAVDRALADDAVRVIVLTGAGDRAFVAGADIEELSAMQPAEARSYAGFLQATLDRLERAPKPLVAAVNGFALGGGCELAMACHVRIAADRAKFGLPEVGLGLIPGAGGTQRLRALVGLGRALDLTLSGELIDAAEALRIGLVTRIAPAAELTQVVEGYVEVLRSRSPIAQSRAIQAVLAANDGSVSAGLRLEAALFGLCFATADMREGTRAFLEKRKADFSGR
jgi:enoyl-CoA hydratase